MEDSTITKKQDDFTCQIHSILDELCPEEEKSQHDRTGQLIDVPKSNNVKLCECGCGNFANPGKRYIKDHWVQKNKVQKNKSESSVQLCECGCGETPKSGKIYCYGHYIKKKDHDYHIANFTHNVDPVTLKPIEQIIVSPVENIQELPVITNQGEKMNDTINAANISAILENLKPKTAMLRTEKDIKDAADWLTKNNTFDSIVEEHRKQSESINPYAPVVTLKSEVCESMRIIKPSVIPMTITMKIIVALVVLVIVEIIVYFYLNRG